MLTRSLLGLGLVLLGQAVGAMDLRQALERARVNDSAYQATRQEMIGLAEAVPQARAALLPNASLTASRNRVWLDREDEGSPSASSYYSLNNALVVRQPLWRRPQWVQLQQAKTQAGTEAFIGRKAEADLLVKVASAYFDLLYAEQSVVYTRAVLEASGQQLTGARRIFELGQGTRTDIDEAQARADLAVAQSQQARQALSYAQRQLSQLVGGVVAALQPLRIEQVSAPGLGQPLQELLDHALENNPDVQLASARLALAELEVSKSEAGHQPTLDLVGQRAISKSENTQSPRSNYLSTQIGVQLNVPLFAGGAVSSAVRQALANRDRERFVLEQVRKDLMLKVEREFNTLTEGGDRLAAARQSLHSARQLVVSVGKGIQAGTRTVIDRTHAMQRQAEALRELALVQYQLQLARLRLAALSGTGLTEAVEEVNRQLAAQP